MKKEYTNILPDKYQYVTMDFLTWDKTAVSTFLIPVRLSFN